MCCVEQSVDWLKGMSGSPPCLRRASRSLAEDWQWDTRPSINFISGILSVIIIIIITITITVTVSVSISAESLEELWASGGSKTECCPWITCG